MSITFLHDTTSSRWSLDVSSFEIEISLILLTVLAELTLMITSYTSKQVVNSYINKMHYWTKSTHIRPIFSNTCYITIFDIVYRLSLFYILQLISKKKYNQIGFCLNRLIAYFHNIDLL